MDTKTLLRNKEKGLYSPFLKKIEELLANCSARGADYYATSGLRTIDEQNALYEQGRTKPGPRVTNAKGGQSFHGFSIAIDVCRDKDKTRAGLQPNWDPEGYKILGEEVAKIPGLTWGGNFKSIKDYPHVELHIQSKGLRLSHLRAAYAKGGYPEVFKLLDGFTF